MDAVRILDNINKETATLRAEVKKKDDKNTNLKRKLAEGGIFQDAGFAAGNVTMERIKEDIKFHLSNLRPREQELAPDLFKALPM